MKSFYFLMFLVFSLYYTNAFAAEPASDGSLSPKQKSMAMTCNLESRNSLINGDLVLAEKVCMQAVREIEKTHAGKEYLVNPIMNLAFAFTLAGQYDKATPLYSRARDIRVTLYGRDSIRLKEIDDRIKQQEEMKRQQSNK